MNEPEMRACAMCVSVYGDKKPKRTLYCSACNRWLCDDCRKRWTRRGIEAVKAFLGA